MAVKSANPKNTDVDDTSKTPAQDEVVEVAVSDKAQESVADDTSPQATKVDKLTAQVEMLTKMLMDSRNAPAGGVVHVASPALTQTPYSTQGTKLPYDVNVHARDMPMHKIDEGLESERESMMSAHFVLVDEGGGRKVIIENVEEIFDGGKMVRKPGSGKSVSFVNGEFDTHSTSVAKYLTDHPMYGVLWIADPNDLGGYWGSIGCATKRVVEITEIVSGAIEKNREPIEFARQG